ncbi:MAG: mRNA surveillance protein pelota [Candidatus Woesearchaeota archaeon]
MKVISSDFKKGFLKVKVENLNDLWCLSDIIEEGDSVGGIVERKINLSNEGEKAKITKKKFYCVIKTEKVDFNIENNSLKINGIIVTAPDDIPKGGYQSINVELGETISIIKDEWPSYQIDKILEVEKETSNILILIFDREESFFYLLENKGHKLLLHLKGEVQKKAFEGGKSVFYKDIIGKLKEYRERYKINTTIIASPSFWKEYLLSEMSEEDKKGIIQCSCSDVNEKTVNEVLKRPELKNALLEDKNSREELLIEELLANINKNNAFYGLKEAREKIEIGNVVKLLVSNRFIKQSREKGNSKQIDLLMRAADKLKAKVFIISGEEVAKKLDGLGGIAGIKIWKEEY